MKVYNIYLSHIIEIEFKQNDLDLISRDSKAFKYEKRKNDKDILFWRVF